jgi:hypothetical protein
VPLVLKLQTADFFRRLIFFGQKDIAVIHNAKKVSEEDEGKKQTQRGGVAVFNVE